MKILKNVYVGHISAINTNDALRDQIVLFCHVLQN